LQRAYGKSLQNHTSILQAAGLRKVSA
jgi:hypothetical protein